jgi:hypothetical protein
MAHCKLKYAIVSVGAKDDLIAVTSLDMELQNHRALRLRRHRGTGMPVCMPFLLH